MGDPPPYTAEQIHRITSPEERKRAAAELQSYIARLKRERDARDNPPQPGSPRFNARGRGHYHRGGGGRGRALHHPYQRGPGANVPRFNNRTLTYGHTEKSDLTTGSDAPTALSDGTLTSNRPDHASTKLCPALVSTGLCSRRGCTYRHDPTKQALCKRWLYKHDCPKEGFCTLSHEPTPHNAPTCEHFQHGHCTNEPCHFAHIRVPTGAPNCEAFGRIGYCEKGQTCTEVHAHECPDFANTGQCSFGDKCRLGHIYRASRMRNVTRPSSEDRVTSSDPEQSKTASEKPNTDMFDSTTASAPESLVVSRDKTPPKSAAFSQQADFVPFDFEEDE